MIDWQAYDGSHPIMMNPGFELYLRKGCEYSHTRFKYRVAEKKELDFLNQFNLDKLTCLDIGANIGYWGVYLAAKLGAKQVHCFEPDPISFSVLEKNITLNKIQINTVAHPYAICETEKTIKLYLHPENSGDNRPLF